VGAGVTATEGRGVRVAIGATVGRGVPAGGMMTTGGRGVTVARGGGVTVPPGTGPASVDDGDGSELEEADAEPVGAAEAVGGAPSPPSTPSRKGVAVGAAAIAGASSRFRRDAPPMTAATPMSPTAANRAAR
jgi:hypothetical protein